MKLTEKQLAQYFQLSKYTKHSTKSCDLTESLDASDKRLKVVESICNDSTVSASYLIINQLKGWSNCIAKDVDNSIKGSLSNRFFTWIRPLVAISAIALVVFISVPQQNNTQAFQSSLKNTNQNKMFTTSFENSDTIKSVSFEGKINNYRKDVITSSNFG